MKIPAYEAWIRKQKCCITGRTPSDPHHCYPGGATAKRNHDEWLVPLYRLWHTSDVCNRYRERFVALAPQYLEKWQLTLDGKQHQRIVKKLTSSDKY